MSVRLEFLIMEISAEQIREKIVTRDREYEKEAQARFGRPYKDLIYPGQKMEVRRAAHKRVAEEDELLRRVQERE